MHARLGHVAALLALLLLLVPAARAQNAVRIEVRDDASTPVAYALVAPVGGNSQVADDSGAVRMRLRTGDSLNLRVRRIGHREHQGWVKRSEDGTYRVTLPRLVAQLATVEVNAAGAAANAPLAQRGFYDRVDRVQKGAILADFQTPEQLDERPGFTKVTQMIAGSRYARVQMRANIPVIVSRGACPMTILLDGQHVTGTIQDDSRSEVPQSISSGGTRQQSSGGSTLSIDDVIDGRSIMAMEIYPSTANAPAELQRLGARGSCGIVVLWTGSRR